MDQSVVKKTINILPVFYFILRFGGGSTLVLNNNPVANPSGFCLYSIVSICLIFQVRKYLLDILNNKILWVALVWIIAQYFIAESFALFENLLVYIDLFLGLSMVYLYKERIIAYYEKIVVYLSAMSIPLWFLRITFGPYFFPHLLDSSTYGDDCWSILIYTINNVDSGDMYMGLTRNPGFAWEPGRFAVLIVIALCFNLFLNKGRSSVLNKSFFILVVALASTFSTTGYVMFIALMMLHFLFDKSKGFVYRAICSTIIIIVSINIYNLPFISEKLEKTSDSDNYLSNGNLAYWESEGESVTVQRFEGIFLDLLNIYDNPFWGYGVARANSYVGKNISQCLITSNGITKPISMFGVFLSIPIFVCLYFSSRKLSLIYNYPNSWILFFVIMGLSFSYDLFQVVIVHSLQLFCFNKFSLKQQGG